MTAGPGSKKRAILFTTILFTTHSYSSTTSHHISQVRMSIPRSGPDAVPVFNVPDLGVNRYAFEESEIGESIHRENVAYYLRKSKSDYEKAVRSRGRGLYDLREAQSLQRECRLYCRFFKVKMPRFPFLPTGEKLDNFVLDLKARADLADERAAKSAVTRRANREARWAARSEQYRLQREQAAQKRIEDEKLLPARMEQWIQGQRVEFGYARPPMMLRITGSDEVETSQGAHVPLKDAKRGLVLVRAAMSSGRAYVRNGHTVHLGHYAVDRIEPDGTLHAGCHLIPWTAINRIAPDLDGRIDQSETILSDVASSVSHVADNPPSVP